MRRSHWEPLSNDTNKKSDAFNPELTHQNEEKSINANLRVHS